LVFELKRQLHVLIVGRRMTTGGCDLAVCLADVGGVRAMWLFGFFLQSLISRCIYFISSRAAVFVRRDTHFCRFPKVLLIC